MGLFVTMAPSSSSNEPRVLASSRRACSDAVSSIAFRRSSCCGDEVSSMSSSSSSVSSFFCFELRLQQSAGRLERAILRLRRRVVRAPHGDGIAEARRPVKHVRDIRNCRRSGSRASSGASRGRAVQGGCTYKKNLEYSVRKIILYSKKCTPAARSAAIKKNHTPRARSAL